MSRIFDTNNPLILIPIFLIGLILHSVSFINPAELEPASNTAPLYLLIRNIFHDYLILSVIIAFLLSFLSSYELNRTIQQNKLLYKNTYFPVLIFLLLISCYKPLHTINPLLLSIFFIILILKKLINIYDKENPFAVVFNIGILTAISTMFYFPSLYILLIVYTGFIFFKVFHWREWIIVIMGFITPYIFYSTYLFWTNQLIETGLNYYNIFNNLMLEFSQPIDKFHFKRIETVTIGLMSIISLIAVSKLLNNLRENLIIVRLTWWVIIWFLIITLFLILKTNRSSDFFTISFIPLSLIISNYIINIKKNSIRELTFTIFAVCIIIITFFIN